MICSCTGCAFIWQFFRVPDSGLRQCRKAKSCTGRETDRSGCALSEGELPLGGWALQTFYPGTRFSPQGSLLCSSLILSLLPNTNPHMHPFTRVTHAPTATHPPIRARVPPRPRTHPSVHACGGALRRPSTHLCTLIHLCTPAPTHWVSI